MRSTWNNTLYYDSVPLTQPFDKVEISTSSAGGNAGSTLTLYADSVETEPICSVTLSATSWSIATIDEVVLDKMYDLAGHRLIVQFYREDAKGSSNFYYIKFVNTGATDKPLVTGGGAAKDNDYTAVSAAASGNTSAADNYVTLGSGASLTFDNVKFRGRAYALKLKYALEEGSAQLAVSKSSDSEPLAVTLDASGRRSKTKEIAVSSKETESVMITNTGDTAVNIYGFDIALDSAYTYDNAVYATMLTSYELGNCPVGPMLVSTHLKDTWDNTLIFDDINIETDFDFVKLRCTTGKNYDGSTMTVYMDGETEPVFSQKIEGVDWDNDTTVYEIKLDKTYPAGYHNFRVKFDGKSEKTCNFHYMQFMKSE